MQVGLRREKTVDAVLGRVQVVELKDAPGAAD